MRIENFMMIESPTDTPAGTSTTDGHVDEIEILSFEHAVERAPTRTDRDAYKALRRARRTGDQIERQVRRDPRMPIGSPSAAPHRASAAELETRLAATLSNPPVTVLKVMDAASPLLSYWATKTDQLLTTVTLTMRTLQPKGTGFELQNLLQVKLTDAFICEMASVGSFPEQPWLSQTSGALWQSAPALDVGPLEQVLFAYQKIEWNVNDKKAFGWDVALKKSF